MFKNTPIDASKKMSNSPVKVQVPLLFSLRHRTDNPNKTSYLLGTCHALPLAVLPDECITVVESCSVFVTEESGDDALEYYTQAILRPENSPDWFSELSPEIADFVEETVDKSFEAFDPCLKKSAPALELWAAYQQVIQGFMTMIAERKSNVSCDNDQASSGMDYTLMHQTFQEESRGLETAMGKIPRFKQEADGIQAFDEIFEASKTVLSMEEQHQELDEIIKNYCNGSLFYNHQDAKEENEEPDMIARNISWIPNLAKHHSELPGPVLFGVGALHLMGQQGLLALLPKQGFKIARLKPDGSFEEYTYPFQSDYIAKIALSRECFFRRFISEPRVAAERSPSIIVHKKAF